MVFSGLSSVSGASMMAQYSAQRMSNTQRPYPTTTSGTPSDTVSLSRLALQRHEVMKLVDGSDVLFDQVSSGSRRMTKTLEEVGQDLQEDLAAFQEGFGSMLGSLQQQMGADSLSMRLDGLGHVLMGSNGEEPNVHTELGDNEVFAARFAVIAARSAILNAAETEPGFKEDYKEDAVGSIQKHIDALAERLFGYRMTARDGVVENPEFV